MLSSRSSAQASNRTISHTKTTWSNAPKPLLPIFSLSHTFTRPGCRGIPTRRHDVQLPESSFDSCLPRPAVTGFSSRHNGLMARAVGCRVTMKSQLGICTLKSTILDDFRKTGSSPNRLASNEPASLQPTCSYIDNVNGDLSHVESDQPAKEVCW